jgi:hypothetical protein
MRKLQGVVLIVNTFLPAILVLVFVGVYFLWITPLMVASKGLVDHVSTGLADNLKHPYQQYADRVAALNRKLETITDLSHDFCKNIGNITLQPSPVHKADLTHELSPERLSVQGTWYLQDRAQFTPFYRTALPVSFDSTRKELATVTDELKSTTVKLGNVKKKLDVATTELGKVRTKLQEAKSALASAKTELAQFLERARDDSCGLVSGPFKRTFTILQDVVSPVIIVANFSQYVKGAYRATRKAYDPEYSAPQIEIDVKTMKQAESVGRGLSNLVTVVTYISIGFAVWLVISYVFWTYGRLQRGWKMVTGKE